MRRRHSHYSEPRADGFVVGGLALVVMLTVGAFAASEAFVTLEAPVARAYTLSALPSAPTDEVTTSSVAVEEVAPVPVPVPATTRQAQAPLCNVAKCAASYRSFNADDCTFQPFEGERRVCPY
ncbi:MAG: BA14K family protein [Rhizobiaceae bacterium]|nr:BA14K family protein [Rhizobiaceae bacterium]